MVEQPLSQTLVQQRPVYVPLLVGYGGGLNSLAVLVGLVQRKLRPDLITFADTGGEKPETYKHLLFVEEYLRQVKFPPLTRLHKESVKTGDISLEEECLRRETMPSRAFGLSSCAQRWKIEPQEKQLNHWEQAQQCWSLGEKPIKILGFDGGEERRAKFFEDKKLRYWYPLIEWDWDRDRCIAEIERAKLPIPPKSACFFCPSSTKTEVLQLAAEHPDLFARAVAIESLARSSTRHALQSVKGLGRHWAWEELVQLDDGARRALSEAPVESCTMCADGDPVGA